MGVRIAAAATAAGLILSGLHPHPLGLINGVVWNNKGATIKVWFPNGSTAILHQGQHTNEATKFRLRYDKRCVYVNTGTVWTRGYYKAKPDITHPTRDYGFDVYAWSKCSSHAKWISAVL